jgi:hypothetical protein
VNSKREKKGRKKVDLESIGLTRKKKKKKRTEQEKPKKEGRIQREEFCLFVF